MNFFWKCLIKFDLQCQTMSCHLFFAFQAPNNVLSYSIVGDEPAPKFFFVNPSSGDISLFQSILETDQREYRVSRGPLLPCYWSRKATNVYRLNDEIISLQIQSLGFCNSNGLLLKVLQILSAKQLLVLLLIRKSNDISFVIEMIFVSPPNLKCIYD